MHRGAFCDAGYGERPPRSTTMLSRSRTDSEVRAPASIDVGDRFVHDSAPAIVKGTPDTGGKGFVVNCTSPIVAPNDVEATDLMPIARSMTWRYEESAHVG